jgi:murein DD-endopeptidase MepM/ murein hydrolase activator NlpD
VAALAALVAAIGCGLVLPAGREVVDPYREPACDWCAGNRGIEWRASQGEQVRSAAAGRVTFAGRVAGAGWVVVEVREGLLVTHGRLEALAVAAGDRVAPGDPVGTSAGSLYVGVRLHGRPVDPLRCGLEAPSGRPRAVLVQR